MNALWEGRLAIDQTLGISPPSEWSHRYRLSLFARTRSEVDALNVVIGVGPYGDIKNYNRHDLYLSRYPTGLLVESNEILPTAPAALAEPEKRILIDRILSQLTAIIPSIQNLWAHLEEARLDGGWVFAAGTGPLDQRTSTLHRRDQIGINRQGGYFSVDTGKYSMAPWLALQITDMILPG